MSDALYHWNFSTLSDNVWAIPTHATRLLFCIKKQLGIKKRIWWNLSILASLPTWSQSASKLCTRSLSRYMLKSVCVQTNILLRHQEQTNTQTNILLKFQEQTSTQTNKQRLYKQTFRPDSKNIQFNGKGSWSDVCTGLTSILIHFQGYHINFINFNWNL